VRNRSLPYRPRSGDSVNSQRFGFLGKAIFEARVRLKSEIDSEKKEPRRTHHVKFINVKIPLYINPIDMSISLF